MLSVSLAAEGGKYLFWNVIVKPNEKLQDDVFERCPSAALDGSRPNPFSFVNVQQHIIAHIEKLSRRNRTKTTRRSTMNHIQLRTKAWKGVGPGFTIQTSDTRLFTECQPIKVLFF